MLDTQLKALSEQVDTIYKELALPTRVSAEDEIKAKSEILCALIAEKATYAAAEKARETSKLLGDKILKAASFIASSLDGLAHTQQ